MHNNKPLRTIKILDLTRLLPGPMCTLHLADMGADVTKIEEPVTGDYARSIPPMQRANSSFFLAVNRNKRSVTLDLTKPEGKKIFLKLSETADVIIESFRPGVVSKLGIDYDTVKNINSKIIYCSITGYGQTGPYRDKAGHDINYCSYTGVIKQVKNGEKPSIPNFQIADIAGGSLNAAMAILAALVYQKTTGKGQYMDISMMDGVLAHSATALVNLSYPDADMLTGGLPCYTIYETADSGFIALGALEFKFWKLFCETIKRNELISSHLVFGKDAEKIYEKVAEIFRANTLAYWIELFKEVDCCISPVLSFKESLKNEQVVARNMVFNHEHPSEGNVLQFGLPAKSSEYQFSIQRSAPLLGEQTEEILSAAGYSSEEIENFRTKKII
ncbi:MAG: CoA transferase [Bacteroidetes bacterium]|nr:MAG: CoA transferase [Bacteroidota bacterium]